MLQQHFFKLRAIIVLIVVFMAPAHKCIAQFTENNYSISFLTTKDGLSQGSNRFMLQDSKGYMWISSQDGINRYNGKEFFHFDHPRFYENCKPFKQVYGLTEDVNGDIWVGTNQGLYKYQQARHAFKQFDVFPNEREVDIISMNFAAVKNEVWVSDCKKSFRAINTKTHTIRMLFEAPDSILLNQFPYVVPQVDEKGNIWIACKNNIYKISTLYNTIQRFSLIADKPGDTAGTIVTAISLHSGQQVLGITTNRGFFLFHTLKEQFIAISDPQKKITNTVTWCVKADNDFFYVSGLRHPLIRLDVNGNNLVSLVDEKALENDVHHRTLTLCMYKDKWNRWWFNSEGEFIAIIDFSPAFLKKVIRGNGLTAGTVFSIAVAGNDIWICDGNLNILKKKTGQIERIFLPSKLTVNNTVSHQLFYDSLQHRIWIVASGKIYYYNLQTKKFVKPGFEFPENHAKSDIVRCFVRLKTGELLVVTRSSVYRLENNGKKGSLINGFGYSIINHLAGLSGGRLGFSAIGQPLKIFQIDEELHVKLIQSIPLKNSPMMVIEDTSRGVIWAATEHGVYKIDNASYKILHHYSSADGMANDFVYAVIPDKYGWIWCSTNKGIVAINAANDAVLNFNMLQNLQDIEFNNRAFSTDNEGYIYFGGVKGLNYFKPPLKDNDTILARLAVEEINLNNNPFASAINPDYLDQIQYPYSAVLLSIKVQALHLKKSTSLKIIYRIKGQQDDWVTINNGEYIQMFNLAPGNYLLEISYRNGSSKDISPKRMISINVLPPWYRTWWFYILVMLAFAAFIYALFQYRLQQKLRVFQVRNRLHRDLHDDVGATLSSVKAYSEILKDNPNNPVIAELIRDNSTDMIERLEVIAWATNPQHDRFGSLKSMMIKFAAPLCHARHIDCKIESNGVNEEMLMPGEIRQNIFLVFKEAINNMIKYADANACDTQLFISNNLFVLQITDNGKGFDGSIKGTGSGWKNMQKRTKYLNGKLVINSTPGKGTDITMSLAYPFKIPSSWDR